MTPKQYIEKELKHATINLAQAKRRGADQTQIDNIQTKIDVLNELLDMVDKHIELPCIAMVERCIKDGNFDRRSAKHNGKMAVVYIDKSKSGFPLIDITSQYYGVDEALDRIEELNGVAES